MYIQWCIKGIAAEDGGGVDEATINSMLNSGEGILCNLWRNKPDSQISENEIQNVLTDDNLDRHVHDYDNFKDDTPFISLAAGAVERDTFLQTNEVHPAIDTALGFATSHNSHSGYLFYCWVIVGVKKAPEIRALAEEIRDLNMYHRWSAWQLEGELSAKINIPANQIHRVEKWNPHPSGSPIQDKSRTILNHKFISPKRISNIREFF